MNTLALAMLIIVISVLIFVFFLILVQWILMKREQKRIEDLVQLRARQSSAATTRGLRAGTPNAGGGAPSGKGGVAPREEV